jgi:hypothetical protein
MMANSMEFNFLAAAGGRAAEKASQLTGTSEVPVLVVPVVLATSPHAASPFKNA